MKKIVILGSTGSIGAQALDVVRQFPRDFKVVGLSTNSNVDLLKKQAEEFKPGWIGITDKNFQFSIFNFQSISNDKILKGENALIDLVKNTDADLVVVSVVGLSGLRPTLEAIRAKKDIALATKEIMVLAGELVLEEVKKAGVQLIPIDSEISAIFQSLKSGKNEEVEKLILTMGKGRISMMNKDQLEKVTIEEVMNRKTWTMGAKISVDSATCLNKAFETIELRWFFDISPDKIDIIVHPEYLCHSLVEFMDGSIIGEFGVPDMRRYIQYALFYPERMKNILHTSLIGKTLTFEEVPYEKFPCLSLGFEALRKGGTMPAILHGADDVAVEAFIDKKIGFMEIPKVIQRVMNRVKIIQKPTLTQILDAERIGRSLAREYIK